MLNPIKHTAILRPIKEKCNDDKLHEFVWIKGHTFKCQKCGMIKRLRELFGDN